MVALFSFPDMYDMFSASFLLCQRVSVPVIFVGIFFGIFIMLPVTLFFIDDVSSSICQALLSGVELQNLGIFVLGLEWWD